MFLLCLAQPKLSIAWCIAADHSSVQVMLLLGSQVQGNVPQAWFADAGYNVCIFAYGQTGSGKTHTMAGTNIEQYEGRGINYRALDDLFALNEKRQGEVSPCN